MSRSDRSDKISYLAHALYDERERHGEVSPQFSYYVRLFEAAVADEERLNALYAYVSVTGRSFAGL